MLKNSLNRDKKEPKGVQRDQKRSIGAKRGPIEPKSISHEPLVVKLGIDSSFQPEKSCFY